jgi:hypothetical protein
MNKEILKKLQEFLKRDKFNKKLFEKRGLNPSPKETINLMEEAINECIKELVELSKQDKPDKFLKRKLIKYLNSLDKSNFDTEEKEFLLDYFDELSKIIQINIDKELDGWIYGPLDKKDNKFIKFLKKYGIYILLLLIILKIFLNK